MEEHRQGSAAIALRRLSHPGRDGGAVVQDDQLSEVARRLSELLAVVEHRTAETDAGPAPRPTERVAPTVLVRPAPSPRDDDTGTATISLHFDTQMLARIDAAAMRMGMSRTAWLYLAAGEFLGDGR